MRTETPKRNLRLFGKRSIRRDELFPFSDILHDVPRGGTINCECKFFQNWETVIDFFPNREKG